MRKVIDLTGQHFGRLSVIKREEGTKGEARWVCVCECGNVTVVPGCKLRNGHTKSCGCLNMDVILERNKSNSIAGKRYGKLLVCEIVGKVNGRKNVYRCKCDCGNEIQLTVDKLQSGRFLSCGCENMKRIRTSRSTGDRLYKVYRGMLERCFNQNRHNYNSYGGRGITVCKEWLGKDGYINFKNWAYPAGYDENADYGECTLDRIDVNGNYEPSNCRWVDMATQNHNKRADKN